ncbi:redoxin domain-containing protein [uncultured Maribacter sp.]|uniref:redoxin domain-containing protein n=1 Tax=uncultured Maribacter sp. TaxID=431308 RepID=UPI002634234D|nr:redoxin domain-containing protein [uncultured Maribacter sp.]
MNRILLFCFLLILASCNTVEKVSPSVFFAGEIVNPTSKYLVLHKGEKAIDSVLLDANNRFSFTFDSIPRGLYSFNHAPEHQYVYLEPGDSLMIRLNTVDFDESLVFSGKGESINNFLIDLFLGNEKEELLVRRTYNALEADDFRNKINSLREKRLEELQNIKMEGNLSDEAYNIGVASVNYTYYNYKERYPFDHRKFNKEKKIAKLPEDFYNYRKNINFNNHQLNYLRPYYNFMRSHFGNLSYMTCSHKCIIKNNEVKNKLHYNKHKLKLIDSLVIEKELKDNLFRNVAIDYLLKTNDLSKNNESFIKEFHKLSKNNRHIKEIDNLYTGIKNIQPGNKIPNIVVTNSSGNSVALQDITKDKKVIFYFWSETNKKHYLSTFKRISQLKARKKGYTFIGINFKTQEDNWKTIINSNNLNDKFQYRADSFDELSKNLIVYPLNKCIITKNGIIVNAFSNIYDRF